MAPNQMQITVEQDMEGCLFCAARPVDGNKRKRQNLRVTFRDAQGPLKVPSKYQVAEYCTKGELNFTQPIKSDLFGPKDYRVLLPFKLLDWMPTGTLLTVRMERVEEEGDVSAEGSLQLVINSGKRAVSYTDQVYLSLFPQMEETAAKLAFARAYVAQEQLPEGDLLAQTLEQMVPQGAAGEEEYLLWLLFDNEKYSGHSEERAQGWLHAAAKKQYPAAVRDEVSTGQMHAEDAEAAAETEQPAAEPTPTDAAAKFALYHQLRESDLRQAEECLVQAVEEGCEEAVEELERHSAQNFLLGSSPEQFIAHLKAGTEHGSLTALYKLFTIYYTGECLQVEVRRDKRAALDYLKRAADAGLSQACYRMWQIFEDGNDLLVKPEEAVELLTRAANSGDAAAMNDLGELYVTGRIVKKDGTKGVELIQKAAELGCIDAQIRVYHMHLDGRYYDILFDVDGEKAYGLLYQYAEAGNPRAQLLLWESYKSGNPMLLTRFEALAFLHTAADQEDREAMFELATADLSGCYKDVDEQEGRRLLERGAKLGCGNAQFALFKLYYTGSYLALHTAVNRERAYKWILRASTSNPEAQFELWKLFAAGNEMNLELEEAIGLLRDSARARCGDALEATGLLFARGEYLQKDGEQAIRYLSLGAKHRHPLSLYRLYEAFSQGRLEQVEVEQDREKAYRMLLLSAQLGYDQACQEVCRLFEDGNPIQVDSCFVRECERVCGPQTKKNSRHSSPATPVEEESEKSLPSQE